MKRKIILSLLSLVTLFGCSNNIANIDSTSEAPFSNKEKDTSSNDSQLDDDSNDIICLPTGDLLTASNNPSKISKDSDVTFKVDCGHSWQGTKDFSYLSENYLNWSYKLIFASIIVQSFPLVVGPKEWPNKIITDLPNFNTSEYDAFFTEDSETLMGGKSFDVTIENSVFQLSNEEIGIVCFYVEIYNNDGTIITNHGLKYNITQIRFQNDGDYIKFN